MSCDRRRAELFGTLAPQIQHAFGESVPAVEVLDLVYDIASSQEPPFDSGQQLAAAAATSKMQVQAAQRGIMLYPHKTGQLAPEAQAAWKQVSDLLDAVERGRRFPTLAQEAFQSLAFQKLATPEAMLWNPPLTPATRERLRQTWASHPNELNVALVYPTLAVDESGDFILRAMSVWLADDEAAPADLQAAAQQFLVLQSAGALTSEERGAWLRTVARAAGFGIGGEAQGGRLACPRCGGWEVPGHTCDEDDAALARAMVLTAAPRLAESLWPIQSPNPRQLAQSLIDPFLVGGSLPSPPPPATPEARLITLAHMADGRLVDRLAAQRGFPKNLTTLDPTWLRDATRIAPLTLMGGAGVWEDGRLYFRADFAEHADPLVAGLPGVRMVAQPSQAVCEIDAADVLLAMSGANMPTSRLRFTEENRLRYFTMGKKRFSDVVVGDITQMTCGCVLACRGSTDTTRQFAALRQPEAGCQWHKSPEITLYSAEGIWVKYVTRTPTFTPLRWQRVGTETEAGA